MDVTGRSSEARFGEYVESLGRVLGHADRVRPLKDYCTGLLMPGERKSVEPMAAVLAPGRVAAEHQSLLHFVGQAPWSDDVVLATVRELVLPSIEACGRIEAWIVDDTGFAKKGVHSVGVARQYCGRLGKTDNCRIAVTLSLANHAASLPVAYRLYLPEDWAGDAARREKARVPADVTFKTKPQIALDQIGAALEAGAPKGVVLADAGYGANGEFRAGLTGMGLVYSVGVQSNTGARPAGAEHGPVLVKKLAMGLPADAWRDVAWREGSNGSLASRFTALRVRPAPSADKGRGRAPEEWLLVEWPRGEKEPTKYWLSTLPDDTALADLVEITKLRWRIERDYEELKSELGLGHFEGRGWRGFHHHATLCIAAYGFLIRERAAFPPSGPIQREKPRLPPSGRRRGSPDPARTPRRKLDRDDPKDSDDRPGEIAPPLPVLPARHGANSISSSLVTQ